MSSVTTTHSTISTNTKPTTSSAEDTTPKSFTACPTTPSTVSENTVLIARATTPSNSPACAVCKYRRRRCAIDCILAPYFPADRQKEFLNVHRLFGVSNMIKVLESIKDPMDKQNAMKTMIYQANVRAIDPTRGCCRVIENLQRQVYYYKAQLDNVCSLLEEYRRRELHGDTNHHSQITNLGLQDRSYIDEDFNNVIGYSDENQLPTTESCQEYDNHLKIAAKNNIMHHIRGKLVGEYMNDEHCQVTDDIKHQNELTSSGSV